MKKYKTIEFELYDGVGIVWLSRPQIHNAFNEVMISEVLHIFTEINKMDKVRIVLLRGRGKSFCAGADLNWMRDVAKYSYDQNYKESLQLSDCFYAIYNCIKPTIGGANGLLAACDMAVCTDDTVFSLSEVKIGIIPACISPYVIKRVGEYGARELMLTGRRINGKEAERFRLVNYSLPAAELEAYLNNLISLLMSSGPKAMAKCKTLIDEVSNNITLEDALSYTAKMIADIRASEEGQEGMAAFLEKRKAKWN